MALLRQLDRYNAARGPLVAYLLGIARHHVFKRLAVSCPESPLDAAGVDESAAAHAGQPSPLEKLSRSETIDRVRMSAARSQLASCSACLLNTRSWICPRPRRHLLHPRAGSSYR